MSDVSFSSALLVIRGKDRGRRFPVEGRKTTIGRHGKNDVQLFDGKTSRHHAELFFEGNSYRLVDLGSSNGTYVNNDKISSRRLVSGDKIVIGNSVMLFTEGLALESDPASGHFQLAMEPAQTHSSNVIRSLPPKDASEFYESILNDAVMGVGQDQKNLRVLYTASLQNSMASDIDEILSRMLNLIFESIAAKFGCILLIDEGAKLNIRAKVTHGTTPGQDPEKYELPQVILERVLSQDQGLLASRTVQCDGVDVQRQVICAPMFGRYGRVGIIYVESELDLDQPFDPQDPPSSAYFSEEHLKLILAIGRQAGAAIEDKIFSTAVIHNERMAAIGETVALISHQIKNIMQGIAGGSFMIQQGVDDQCFNTIKQGWGIVDKNQHRVSDLIQDMLSYSKERKPSFQFNDLIESIRDVIETAEAHARESQVSIQTQLPTDCKFYFDSEMINRALINVVNNAIDACADLPEGIVSIKCRVEKAAAVVEISDNGVGIQPADLKTIFSPYHSTKGGRGTGLGLTVARKIYREHGGQITVRSQPDQGTCFFLSLPLWSDSEIVIAGDPDNRDDHSSIQTQAIEP